MTRRGRRRLEAALALLAFPVAIALTVLAITTPAAGSRDDGTEVALASAVHPVPHDLSVSIVGGDAMTAFTLADDLAAQGFDIVAVSPRDNSVSARTSVVYYVRERRGDAAQLRNLLGVGTIHREQVFSPSSDITIRIGKDLQST